MEMAILGTRIVGGIMVFMLKDSPGYDSSGRAAAGVILALTTLSSVWTKVRTCML